MSLSEAIGLHRSIMAAAGRSPDTIAKYGTAERGFAAWLRELEGREPTVDDLTLHAARAWLWALQSGGRTGETARQYGRALTLLSRTLVAEGILRRDPLATLELPRGSPPRLDVYTRAEMIRMLALAASPDVTPSPRRSYAIIALLADTGLRLGEVLGLRLDDFAPRRGDDPSRLLVRRGKGNKPRVAYPGNKASLALGRYIRSRERPRTQGDAPLFTRDGRAPLSEGLMAHLCRALGKAAGIEDKRNSPHTWRRSWATHFAREHGGSASMFELQRRLGHSTLQMTRHYVQLAELDSGEAWSVLDEWQEVKAAPTPIGQPRRGLDDWEDADVQLGS